MAYTSLRQAVADKLKGTAKVTGLLGDGANSIILAGRLAQGGATPTSLPAILIQDGGSYGRARNLPFFETRFYIRVMDAMPAAGAISYVKIDKIGQECIEALHRKLLTPITSYYNVFETFFDDYISPDQVDQFTNLAVKSYRFCVYGSYNRYDPSGYV